MKTVLARLLSLNLILGLVATLFAGDSTSVQLFFTGDVYGYIKPCG